MSYMNYMNSALIFLGQKELARTGLNGKGEACGSASKVSCPTAHLIETDRVYSIALLKNVGKGLSNDTPSSRSRNAWWSVCSLGIFPKL